jgi:predicted enzyme related to lactoylglutathione lyase
VTGDRTAAPPLLRVVVSVTSLSDGLRFYRDVVGLPVVRSSERFGWLATEEGVEVLLHERPATPSDAAVTLTFGVADVDAAVAGWRAQGGSMIDPPETQSWGERMAVVRDADGHVVCLVQR